jgi:superfamily II DNA/RNA helicase
VILLNSVTSGFDAFPLSANLPAAIKAAGYRTPTPIRAQTIATALAGRDVIGTARAGVTGHATSFAAPEECAQLHAIERHIGRPLPRRVMPAAA